MGRLGSSRGRNLDDNKEADRSLRRGRKFWAFQPLSQVSPPPVKNESWVRTPLDRFILARLEEKKLFAQPPGGPGRADPAGLPSICRALPPSPQEIDSFVNDASPDRS